MSSLLGLPDSDSEDELPGGWEERATLDGKVYYVNHTDKVTQWNHPRTGRKKVVPEGSGFPTVRRLLSHVLSCVALPYGWERSVLEDGQILYVDHVNHKTCYTDPRLAFAMEEKDPDRGPRQRFDGSSTALQVLHGMDLSGRVAIVTGANTGIGFETARSLALHGAHVILACRDPDKTAKAMELIHVERPQAKLESMLLDLGSFQSVRQFTEEFLAKHIPLHLLILNAGVFAVPYSLTEDGYETTFQVNHLAQFYLTQLLLDVVKASAPARIVILSSESHRFSFLTLPKLSPEYLSPPENSYTALYAYNLSKHCNTLFASELQQRLRTSNVSVYAVHPGNMVSSELARYWWVYRLLFTLVRPFTKSLQQAAATTVYCAVAPELEDVDHIYYSNCCRCEPSSSAHDPQLAKYLWEFSEMMIRQSLKYADKEDESDT